MPNKTALIIGAGPAGLTAAYELLTRTDIHPIVLESSHAMGGISQTVEYHGNRMDIGGHRFFSKSERVMHWWLEQLPLADPAAAGAALAYHGRSASVPASPAPRDPHAVMLVRPRKSRIYFLRQFFDYPLKMNARTLRQLGLRRLVRIAASYARAALLPPKAEDNLEQFLIRRFGRELYRTFFKSYTEKVWGVPCSEISAAWGAQRIKGLSLRAALAHVLRQLRPGGKAAATETSLIEQFLYPKLGPGQLWQRVADRVRALGGDIVTGCTVDRLQVQGSRVVAVGGRPASGERRDFRADFVISTMAIQDLVPALAPAAPPRVRSLAAGLLYRDFITVGLLLRRLAVPELTDNWIYIQEPDVLAGRLQIFNNWSPALVRDPATVWIGVEYFCYQTDPLWSLSDADMSALAARELEQIGLVRAADVLDATVVRMPKTYPAYFGEAYAHFSELQTYLDGFENLFLVGRNGMHKYNNQDHSMLTAMTAVDNILAGRADKANLWAVNTEMEFHEAKRAAVAARA